MASNFRTRTYLKLTHSLMAAFSEASLRIFKPLSSHPFSLPTGLSCDLEFLCWSLIALPLRMAQECFIWYVLQGTINKWINKQISKWICSFKSKIFFSPTDLWLFLKHRKVYGLIWDYLGNIFRPLSPKDKIIETSNSNKVGGTSWFLPRGWTSLMYHFMSSCPHFSL